MKETVTNYRNRLAAARYGRPGRSLSIIAVSGRAGKTTTIRLLEEILKESGRSVASITDNSIVNANTLYETLAKLKSGGKSTIILEVHDQLIESGGLLGLPLDTLLIVNANEHSSKLLGLSPKHVVAPIDFVVPSGSVEPYQQIHFGEDDAVDARIDSMKLYRFGTELAMTIDHQTKLEVATHLAGRANALNLAAAVAAAYVTGTALDAVQEGVADMESPEGVFLWQRTNQPYEIVQDNATWDESIHLAVESAKQLAKRRLIVALDNAPSSDTLQFMKSQADRLFIVGEAVEAIDADVVTTPEEALEKASRSAKRDDVVLLLGPSFVSLATQGVSDQSETDVKPTV